MVIKMTLPMMTVMTMPMITMMMTTMRAEKELPGGLRWPSTSGAQQVLEKMTLMMMMMMMFFVMTIVMIMITIR